MAENEQEEPQPIIVKKINKGGDGHHGGAWKVAYADFVTAMMAFFLLMWLLNVTTAEQKNAISSYFDPSHPKISDNLSGSGGVLGGLSVSPDGALSTTVSPFAPPSIPAPPSSRALGESEESGEETADGPTEEELEREAELARQAEELARQEQQTFDKIEQELQEKIQQNPALKELAENLLIDQTPEGLRIQLIDQNNQAMFALGSARLFERTRNLVEEVTNAILDVPNKISIRGHTDAIPYRGRRDYSNWELSTDRANSTRRVMLAAGFTIDRIQNVVGKAATDPLIVENPRAPQNRRISIILMRENTIKLISDNEGNYVIDRAQEQRSLRNRNRVFDYSGGDEEE